MTVVEVLREYDPMWISQWGITEVEAMGEILQELGVEVEKLILEKEAFDTTTNAYNILKLV